MSLTKLETFLISQEPHPLVNSAILKEEYIAIDLSVYNPDLKSINVGSSNDLESYIWSHIKKNNAKVAYGGYIEQRGIYQRSDYFNQQNLEKERNIHLGLDLWIEAGTSIYAPLEGKIHSFKNNTNYGDYGPTIILKHSFDTSVFFTLYGHLSLESITGNQVGDKVEKGQQLATLGTAEVNGDYAPHLHFQIIKDIQDYKGDYPGVSNQIDVEFYKQNCPDPNLLLKLN